MDDLAFVEVGSSNAGALAVAAVGPHAAGHVVAGAQEHVAGVRAPGEFADGVVVGGQDGERALGAAGAEVEGADVSVDAGGGDDGGAVFVPVVRQRFRRRAGGAGMRGRGRVQRHRQGQVVGGRGRGPQIEDPQLRVRRHRREDGRAVRRECGAVRAAVGWKGEDGGGTVGGPLLRFFLDLVVKKGGGGLRRERIHDFYSAVPGAGAEVLLADEVPVHCKHLSLMLLP